MSKDIERIIAEIENLPKVMSATGQVYIDYNDVLRLLEDGTEK